MSQYAERLEMYMNKIKPLEIVIDLGAFQGSWTAALTRLRPDNPPHIYMVEPIWHKGLKSMLNVYKNVTIIPYGISDRSVTEEFTAASGGRGQSAITHLIGKWMHEIDGKKESVQCYTWDDLVDKYGITRVDLVKIDVQGMEQPMFNAMTKVIPAWLELEYSWKDNTHEKCSGDMPEFFKKNFEFVMQCGKHNTFVYKRFK